MAATGLPKDQPDHAIIAAEFAAECMEQIKAMSDDLLQKFGMGTDCITMRFGLNST